MGAGAQQAWSLSSCAALRALCRLKPESWVRPSVVLPESDSAVTIQMSQIVPLQAIRAPLVVTILQAYQQVSPQVWAQELPQLFSCFAKLVCSAQPSVRKHLGQLMHMQVPQALN